MAAIGLVGIAVMGENLVLNLESKGFQVAVYNRTVSRVDEFMSGRGSGKKIVGCRSVEAFASALASPRKILIMVKAGKPVDDTIAALLPHLAPGDIIIDGGNSHYPDTQRRVDELSAKGFLFVGCGVSGGEEGALHGPSMMPGGDVRAWPALKPIFQAISAKAPDGSPCCDWIGSGGAGHFVKMVHNGIEYGDMQLLCEGYTIMRKLLGMRNADIADAFDHWNQVELSSFLVEITRDILRHKDTETPAHDTVDVIVDRAGQKGTGKWTAIAALDSGMPLTLIGEAVFGRTLSAMKEERVEAARLLGAAANPEINAHPLPDRQKHLDALRGALYAAKIVSYAQGFVLMREVSRENKWDLQFGSIALTWRSGCIITSVFLADIKNAFDANPALSNLLLAPFFREQIAKALPGWRHTASIAVLNGAWTPAITSALAYYDGYTSARLPHNLLQAQRDYFGAHTFERVDKPAGQFFHENWTGRGGSTTSTTYST